MKWKTLEHNGVLFPPEYNYQGISIKINGEKRKLTEIQEEMAWAWTKKRETPYVKDKEFINWIESIDNFHLLSMRKIHSLIFSQ